MTDYGSFTCDDCGRTFPKGRSDEEAAAEAAAELPGVPADELTVVVCDDCYQAMRKRATAVGFRWGVDGREVLDTLADHPNGLAFGTLEALRDAAVDAAVDPPDSPDRA